MSFKSLSYPKIAKKSFSLKVVHYGKGGVYYWREYIMGGIVLWGEVHYGKEGVHYGGEYIMGGSTLWEGGSTLWGE